LLEIEVIVLTIPTISFFCPSRTTIQITITTTLDDAIELGKIKVTTGSVDDFKNFVSVIDTGLKGYPVDSKALDIG
jgi:hypothetical protein